MTMRHADLTMKTGPEVPKGAHRPQVADAAHFRVVADHGDGQRSLVLYLPGAHISARHTDLPTVPAEQVDGVWRPAEAKGRKR